MSGRHGPVRRPFLAPPEILGLDAAGADGLLNRLEADVPVGPGLLELPLAPGSEAIVFGDTHGDWPSTVAVAATFLADPGAHVLLGLGDDIDRPPEDCPNGSVANALYLLGLRAAYPDRVFLLQGNHEATRRIPVVPHDLPEEVDDLWGPNVERYHRLLGLLERGDLAARTESGVYFAHAGFPDGLRRSDWRERFQSVAEPMMCDLLWRDAAASQMDRGLSPPFGASELGSFLTTIGARCFVRGHDPDLTGRQLYGGRCLTIHTTRVYERYGGVLLARVSLDRDVGSTEGVVVEHLPTEGRSFPEP
ncbi:MAG: metallophosphoesterase [Thermoplasmata archaeon]